MNRQPYPIKPTARFRRWTRKGYAVFSTLGRCVTIGQLRKNVTERALGKQPVNGQIDIQEKELTSAGEALEAGQPGISINDDQRMAQGFLLLSQTTLVGSHTTKPQSLVAFFLISYNEEAAPPRNGEEQPLPHLISLTPL